ncbi:hypothetical protein [Paludibacterium yongneupense]|uniref:hypothetical protein n=1 Tax=Paludibacterium yongneupense TaxID=400061 RepID=UPI00048F302D|nr:hypothetical protein [Paludibacterium yongneupense]
MTQSIEPVSGQSYYRAMLTSASPTPMAARAGDDDAGSSDSEGQQTESGTTTIYATVGTLIDTTA